MAAGMSLANNASLAVDEECYFSKVHVRTYSGPLARPSILNTRTPESISLFRKCIVFKSFGDMM